MALKFDSEGMGEVLRPPHSACIQNKVFAGADNPQLQIMRVYVLDGFDFSVLGLVRASIAGPQVYRLFTSQDRVSAELTSRVGQSDAMQKADKKSCAIRD